MLGNERRPVARFGQDTMLLYYKAMEMDNINWQVCSIAIPKLACIQGLGNIYRQCTFDGPQYRVFDESDKVDGEDKVTVYDVEVFCYLSNLMKQSSEKMNIDVRLNANVIAMLKSEGLM